MTLERFREIAEALRHAFPARGGAMVDEIIERLGAGPWDPPREQGAIGLDPLLADVGRVSAAFSEELFRAFRNSLGSRLQALRVLRALRIVEREELEDGSFRFDNFIRVDDLAQWATDALETGFDGPAIRELAGSRSAEPWDFARLLDRCVAELPLDVQVPHSGEISGIRLVARKLLARRIGAVTACRLFHLLALPRRCPDVDLQGIDLSAAEYWLESDDLPGPGLQAIAREILRRPA